MQLQVPLGNVGTIDSESIDNMDAISSHGLFAHPESPL